MEKGRTSPGLSPDHHTIANAFHHAVHEPSQKGKGKQNFFFFSQGAAVHIPLRALQRQKESIPGAGARIGADAKGLGAGVAFANLWKAFYGI